jgi:hypothetical protein
MLVVILGVHASIEAGWVSPVNDSAGSPRCANTDRRSRRATLWPTDAVVFAFADLISLSQTKAGSTGGEER